MIFELLGLFGLSGINHSLKKGAGKRNANQYGMYKDGNGQYRLVQNGHWVVETYNDYGERIIKNVKTGATEINIDAIECKKRKQEAITNGDKYYLYRYERANCPSKYKMGNQDIIGNRYRKVDINDGLFVKRKITYEKTVIKDGIKKREWYCGEFFMDMNGVICEATSETKTKDKEKYGNHYLEQEQKIINCANEHAKKKIFNVHPYSKWKDISLEEAINDDYKLAKERISHWK